MKKKSASKSAFFNLRVLIGLCIALAGISLALVALDAFAVNSAPVKIRNHIITASNDPLVPVGFDCTKIEELGIDKQENFRAGAIMMACAADGDSGFFLCGWLLSTRRPRRQKITRAAVWRRGRQPDHRPESSPNITQSETFTGLTRITPNRSSSPTTTHAAAMLAPINISGASVSTDGGATFTRVTRPRLVKAPLPVLRAILLFCTTRPTRPGSPCGSTQPAALRASGGYKSTTPSDPNSWTHFCVHSKSSADRESGCADNNPASPFFGRMYISWNDFNVACGAAAASSSFTPRDGGTTWSSPVQVSTGADFIRNVQITGDKVTGDVYIAGMNEIDGGTRQSGQQDVSLHRWR